MSGRQGADSAQQRWQAASNCDSSAGVQLPATLLHGVAMHISLQNHSYIAAHHPTGSPLSPSLQAVAFRIYDIDATGRIERPELKRFLVRL